MDSSHEMITISRARRLVAVALAAAVAFSAALQASQPQVGTLSGTATTPTGETLAKVAVQLRDLESGDVVGAATSSETGTFTFASLPPGRYTVEVLNAAGQIVATSGAVSVAAGATVAGVSVSASAAAAGAAAGAGAGAAAAGGAAAGAGGAAAAAGGAAAAAGATAAVSTAAIVTTVAAAAGVAGAIATVHTASPSS